MQPFKGIWSRLLEPGQQVEEGQKLFSNSDLKKLIVPLFVEQLLAMLVGIADTLMVSYAGEAAVSGVSLVNMLNIFFIFLFTALASGGAVVVSQYIGSRDRKNSSLAAGQLYLLSLLFSLACMGATLLWDRPLLGLLFGRWSRTSWRPAPSTCGFPPTPTPSWRCTTPGRPCTAA